MHMTLEEARTATLLLIAKHLPDRDIEFEFSNTKRVLGQAIENHTKPRWGKIRISRHHVRSHSREEVMDTILHEIAHLVAGCEAGHGPRWRAACRKLGATPERVKRNVDTPEGYYRYRVRCRTCEDILPGGYHRKPRRDLSHYQHTNCGGALELIEE